MVLLFDENVPQKIAEGLGLLELANYKSKYKAEVTHISVLGKAGIDDEDVIKLAGELKATIVTFDGDFKHKKHYYSLYKEHNVGILLFKSSKSIINYWDNVVLIVSRWEELKEKISKANRPFALELGKNGIQTLSF